jgi:hypothetical protein
MTEQAPVEQVACKTAAGEVGAGFVQELTECAEKRSHDKEDDGNGGRRHECRPLLAYGRCKWRRRAA